MLYFVGLTDKQQSFWSIFALCNNIEDAKRIAESEAKISRGRGDRFTVVKMRSNVASWGEWVADYFLNGEVRSVETAN